MDTAQTLHHLTLHDIKPSMQRMAVMEYLLEHRTHPTADDIYNDLHPALPTLSKTTVYNTLKILVEKGAALQLTIDDRNSCYDAYTDPHAHFLCTHCGKVFDVPLKKKNLLLDADLQQGFQPEEVQLYLRGICPECATRTEAEA